MRPHLIQGHPVVFCFFSACLLVYSNSRCGVEERMTIMMNLVYIVDTKADGRDGPSNNGVGGRSRVFCVTTGVATGWGNVV